MGSETLVTVVALAVLALVPFLLMVATSFVKLSVVLSILRNALGTGQVPSSAVITALAAILSLYVMAPVGEEIVAATAPYLDRVDGDAPLAGESLDAIFEAVDAGKVPLVAFLTRNANEGERALFYDLAVDARGAGGATEVTPGDFFVVLPAFMVTELAEAFLIGFLIFIPFLVVDLVVSNVLLSLGMHMLSPTTISLPFKLLLFVLVDGWYLLAHALVTGYA